jgi:hypothetical protein
VRGVDLGAVAGPSEGDDNSQPTFAGCLLMLLGLAVIVAVALTLEWWRDPISGKTPPRALLILIPVVAGALFYTIVGGLLRMLGVRALAKPINRLEGRRGSRPPTDPERAELAFAEAYHAGFHAFEAGDLNQALPRFEEAVTLRPDDACSWECYVRLPFSDLGKGRWRLTDLMGGAGYDQDGDDLHCRGLYLDVLPWQASVFSMARRA